LQPPCPRIITWPEGWTVENIVAWVVAADESVLVDAELVAAGLPRTAAELVDALQEKGPKTDEVLHAVLADAISQHTRCCARVAHLLTVLGAIATGRNVPAGAATLTDHPNDTTKIWKINDAVPGI
jgi:hypothetical protein